MHKIGESQRGLSNHNKENDIPLSINEFYIHLAKKKGLSKTMGYIFHGNKDRGIVSWLKLHQSKIITTFLM